MKRKCVTILINNDSLKKYHQHNITSIISHGIISQGIISQYNNIARVIVCCL